MIGSQENSRQACGGSRAPLLSGGGRGWLFSALLAVFLAAWSALSGFSVPAMAADVRSTPHNLAQKRSQVDADEVCVFCHTPQVPLGLKDGRGTQPAWQKSLSADHSYIIYDDIGRKQFGATLAVGSQSIACLSCHDASQAFQVTSSQSDHPFGVPYRGFLKGRSGNESQKPEPGGESSAPSRAAMHLKSVNDFRLPSKGTIEDRTIWWVSAQGISASRTRSDLPLYARPDQAGGEVPYIECSSCHDPHIARPLFLRVTNEGSKLCLTCHDK